MHVIIFMSWPLYPRHKGPGTHWIGSWMQPGLNVKFLPGIILGLSISYQVVFTPFRKAIISYVMSVISVSLSVCTKQLRTHWTESHKIWSSRIYRKSVEKIQVSLKSDTNNGHLVGTYIHYDNISLNSYGDEKYFRQILEKIKTTFHATRVETLIVAIIYLQLIQNRYMFRSFTVLHCSHQHCVQPVASDVEVVGYL